MTLRGGDLGERMGISVRPLPSFWVVKVEFLRRNAWLDLVSQTVPWWGCPGNEFSWSKVLPRADWNMTKPDPEEFVGQRYPYSSLTVSLEIHLPAPFCGWQELRAMGWEKSPTVISCKVSALCSELQRALFKFIGAICFWLIYTTHQRVLLLFKWVIDLWKGIWSFVDKCHFLPEKRASTSQQGLCQEGSGNTSWLNGRVLFALQEEIQSFCRTAWSVCGKITALSLGWEHTSSGLGTQEELSLRSTGVLGKLFNLLIPPALALDNENASVLHLRVLL